MENWPRPYLPSMTRFCCKLMNTGQVKHYDIDSYQTITQMLSMIKPLINLNFNLSNHRLKCENGCILLNSVDKINKKFSSNFVILTIIPDYMYSKPECIFYNSRGNSDRISYLIKQDAIKKIQHFYRSIFKKECPCCYELFNNDVKYYNCNHSICSNCFNDWNTRSSTCPLCRESVKQEYAIEMVQEPIRIQNSIINDRESLGYIWNILRATHSNMPHSNTIETTTNISSEIIHSSRRRQLRRSITELPTLYNYGELSDYYSDEENGDMAPDNTPFSQLNY